MSFLLKIVKLKIVNLYKWCTKTRLRKILSSILAVLILLTSIRFIFLKPKVVLATDVLLGFNEGYGTTTNGSAGSNSGTITNALWKSEEFCKIGKCLYFDGNGDYVEINDTDNSLDSTGSFALTAWVRLTSDLTGYVTVINKGDTASSINYYLVLDSNEKVGSSFSGATGGGISTESLTINKWHQIGVVFDDAANTQTFYIDGKASGTHSVTGSPSANNGSLDIGAFEDPQNTYQEYFPGFIDEIKIYPSSAKTAAEVKAEFNGSTASRGTSASFGPDNSWLSSGLVGYWKMDESSWTGDCSTLSVTDSSGRGINGSACPNASAATTAAGKFGKAGSFDGTNDYVQVLSPSLPTADFTYTAWVNLTDSTNETIFMSANSSGTNELIINVVTGVVGIGVDGGAIEVSSTDTIPTSTWGHLAVTRTSGVMRIYVNGNLQPNTATNSTVLVFDSCALLIGADTDSSASNCTSANDLATGKIDDARVYNRALSPAEVQKLYNWAPGPVAEWKMDENTSTAVNDTSSNGNTGTFNGTGSHWLNGKFGASGNFNGSDDYVNAGTTSNLDGLTNNLTVSVWAMVRSTSGTKRFVSHARTNSSTGISAGWQNGGNLIFTTWGVKDYITTGLSLSANTWYHFTYVMDTSDDVHFYINGVFNQTVTGTTPATADTDDNFYLGATTLLSSSTLTEVMNGQIDDVKIYNYQRTPGQIVEDMNAGHPAPGSPVGSAVAKWKFDEGYGTTAYDSNQSTGGPEDLTLSTASWTSSGKFNKAWNGDGTLWASRANDADLDFGASESFTLSGWFKSDSGTNPANGTEYLLSTSTGNTDVGYQVYAKTDGTICFAIDDDGTWTDIESCSSTDLYDNTWHNFVAVRNVTSDTTKIYIDGSERDSDTDPTTGTLDGDNVFYIGDFDGDNNGTAGTEEFAGDIDDVQIFRSALTLESIQQLYNQGSMAVMGAISTDSSGVASWSNENEYCPPRSSGTCTPPVAEWKMDENTGTTLNDTSGNAYTSTSWVNNTRYDPGKFGSGLFFDGDNDVVRIDPAASSYLDTLGGTSDSYSVSAWFKTSATGTNKAIVYKRNDLTTYPFTLGISSSTNAIDFLISDGTTTCTSNSGTLTVTDGKWHHTAAVLDTSANLAYLYLDGALVDRDNCSTNSTANSEDISIGNGRRTLALDYQFHDFNGHIDQVRIYNYARPASEVAWEFGHGNPTIGWWKLDDNVSGNGATIYNSTVWASNGTTDDGANNTGMSCTVAGKRNLGCDLDGTDDNINMGDIGTLDFGDLVDFSIAGWFNRDTFTTDDTIVSKQVGSGAGTTDAGYTVFIDDATDMLTFRVCDGDVACDEYKLESTTTFTATGWNHFVATWDDDSANNTKIFINGVDDNASATGTIGNIGSLANTRNFRLGILHGGVNQPFDGKIDDIMMFNHALNAQEVRNIYNGGAVNIAPLTGTP